MVKNTNGIRTICVYCGSQMGTNPAYQDAARVLGKAMAEHGIALVYGGGTRGIMGTVADAVLAHGGKVIGIIPEFLMDKEATRKELGQLTELVVTKDMHERKHIMFERSDAFVALPGGIGTLEEIVEIMTWAQLGRHVKPMVFGNVDGFWNPLNTLISHMSGEGFIHTAHLVQPQVIDDAAAILPAVIEAAARAEDTTDEAVISRL